MTFLIKEVIYSDRMLQDTELDAAFAALAHPTRRAILGRLAHGPATVSDLAAPFAISLPAVSQHIKVLEAAGLITRGRDAQFRPCTLNPQALARVAQWSDQYRHIWAGRFDAMAQILDSQQERPNDTDT